MGKDESKENSASGSNKKGEQRQQQEGVLDVVRQCQRRSFLQEQEDLHYDCAIARQIEEGRNGRQAMAEQDHVEGTASPDNDVEAMRNRPSRQRNVLVDESVISVGGNQEVLKALALHHQMDQGHDTTASSSIGNARGNACGGNRTEEETDSDDRPASRESLPGAYSGEPGTDLVRNEKVHFSKVGRFVPSCTSKTVDRMDSLPSSASLTTATSSLTEGGGDSNPLIMSQEIDEESLAIARKVRASEKTPHDFPLAEEMDCSVVPEEESIEEDVIVQATKTVHWMGYAGCALACAICLGLATFLILLILSFHYRDNQQIVIIENPPPKLTEETTNVTTPEQRLYSLLPEYLAEEIVYHTDATAQGRAFQWVVNDPNILSYNDKRIQQRYALATIYYATHGPRWNPTWLDYNKHECDWDYYMPFGPQYDALVVRYSKYKHIDGPCQPPSSSTNSTGSKGDNEEYLYLALYGQKGLHGRLPQELAMLTSLRMIQLGETNLEGAHPVSILSQLTSLQELHIMKTDMKWSIPSEVGILTSLELLQLGGSKGINGQLPTELGLLSRLHTLTILETNITGPLPVELSHLNHLKELQISGNAVTGSIPTEYGKLSKVDWLHLGVNELTGQIPSQLGNLDSLWLAYFYNNQLSGSIPTELGKFMGDIEQLYLSNNRLTGTIPIELAPPKNEILLRLRLDSNHLTGTVPSELGLLTTCSSLSFNNNDLTGSIPQEVGAIEAMKYFRASDNHLSGTVPWQQFLEHPNMVQFWIGNNQLLSGSIPPGIGGWQNITHLKIGNTSLSGPLPTEIGSLKELNVLELGPNPFLTGQIPEHLCSFEDDPGLTLIYDCGSLCGCKCSCNETTHP